MPPRDSTHSWFGPTLLGEFGEASEDQQEFRRQWRGFMTARVILGLVLFLLQGSLYLLGQNRNLALVLLCAGYFLATLTVRLVLRPRRLGRNFDRHWFASIGVDVLFFSALHLLQGNAINYTPLYTLPVLQAAVLGTLTLGMGTAAGVALLLLGHSAWLALHGQAEGAHHFIQAALTGAGSFVLAFLAHELAARLAREQQRARRSQHAMRLQQQVNDLVIESMSDGVLVVDARGTVHAANPAARRLLQAEGRALTSTPFSLTREPGWQPLADLALLVFTGHGDFEQTDLSLQHRGESPRPLRVRTRLTTARWRDTDSLCVLFLQDQREIEARMRSEKLASMGRMSAAVAHEIRNPLAAIAQANALLDEDLVEPRLKRLTDMIGQNAKRLDRIVDDVLNVSRVGKSPTAFEPQAVDLPPVLARICRDWAAQTASEALLRLHAAPGLPWARFDAEHLRRVLINLLDNARRYASRQAESIQVLTQPGAGDALVLAVWSDGAPLEPSVEQHLFEPFFSSESRSSGLGLYICRELCEGHGATIAYQRTRRLARNTLMDGNEFFITLRRAHAADGAPPAPRRLASP